MTALLPCLALFAAISDDDLARELPRIPPTAPAEAGKTFRIRPGFRLDLVASEPRVADPVSAAFDADGRLYVVEMRGYPYPEKVASGKCRLLEDRDGDGRFETSTVFLDGLSWPTSVLPYDGGVFLAVPPDILYAKDTDGDGRADVRKVLFSGFGTQNVQALVNGLLWGPDGWVYGVSGGNGGEIRNLTRPGAPAVSVRGRDFRFRPDGSTFEAASGGGQFGHAFDDWGHRFSCNNSNHIRQIVLPARYLDRNPHLDAPAAIVDIAVEGPAAPVFRISPPEPWRVVRTRQRLADPEYARRLAPTERHVAGFFTSATGVTIYRGSAFPPEFRGNAFVGDVGGNLVHRKTLAPAGPIYRATRADAGVEFLASSDNWFRPVNFVNTPSGTLLVLDMYRETIEHPASIPEPIKKHLDLTSGHDKGRIYEIVPEGFRRPPRRSLSRMTTPELVGLLGDPNGWTRETAQRLLIERKDAAATSLLERRARSSGLALETAHALWALDALGALRAEAVGPALGHRDPRVREQAARLAGRFGDREGGIRSALIGLASDADAMVRLQVAFSLGEIRHPDAVKGLAAIVARDPADPWIRAAVLSSVLGRARALAEELEAEGFFARAEGRAWLEALAAQVGAEGDAGEVAAMLGRFANGDPGRAAAVVAGLGRGLGRSGKSFRVVERGTLDRLAPVFARAVAEAAGDGPEEARVAAIRLVGLGPVETAREALSQLLDARQPVSVQLAALRALADLPGRGVGEAIAARWAALGPAARREAAEALMARPERVRALLEAIRAGAIAPADLDPARRAQLLSHPDPEIRKAAADRFDREAPDRGRVLAAYRSAPARPGDPRRGRDVFRKNCATCHRAEGEGNAVGPDLATTAHRTAEELLIHILDPNREIAPAYLNYAVALTDGRVLSGLIAEETGSAVTLKRAEGVVEVVPRGRIEQVASTGLSLMPEGLERSIDPAAMADLIAYVRALPGGASPRR